VPKIDGRVVNIPIDQIRPYKGQPREHFDEGKLAGLAHSIQVFGGVVIPIHVRRVSDGKVKYELIAGERRLRAAKAAGQAIISAIVADTCDETEQYTASFLENVGREGYAPMEEANGFRKLMKMHGLNIADTARLCGRDAGWGSRMLSLLKLESEVQAMLNPSLPEEEQLTVSLAVALSSRPARDQVRLARRIVKHRMGTREAQIMLRGFDREKGLDKDRVGRPHDDFRKIKSLAERTSRDALYCRGLDLMATLQPRLVAERTELLRDVRGAIAELCGLRDRMEKTVKDLAG
jgi:ParB family chromosome partitioning protein